MNKQIVGLLGLVFLVGATLAPRTSFADYIDPASFSATVDPGYTVTLHSSLTITAGSPTDTYSSVGIDASEASFAGLGVSISPTDSFSGSFDRSADTTFAFDAIFTALSGGTYDFHLYGLVDGARVDAMQTDHIVVNGRTVPEPSTLLLLGIGLAGLGLARRPRLNWK